MPMLPKYKRAYLDHFLHFVTVDYKGVVIDCDSGLKEIKPGVSLPELHPFFYSLESAVASSKSTFSFHCVHLDIGEQHLITDIEILKKENTFLIVIQDLTGHYLSFVELTQTRNESIIKEELLALKNLELEEREKFKDRFIQNFSHELRNPLTSIILLTNFLGNTNLDGEQREILRFLKESNANLRALLEDILSISMISSEKLQLRTSLFNLHELFKLLQFTYRSKAKGKKLDFNLVVGTNVPEYLEGDRLRLFQVLTNLLDNAIKCTHKGYVLLEVKLNQKWANKVSLHFMVSDTGTGIASKHLQSIFESFSQVNANSNEKGTGLGLSIVKGLVELMQGNITVKSKLGVGSEFHVDVVLRYPLPSTIDFIGKKSKDQVDAAPGSGKHAKFKILLVEDDMRIQTVVFKTLIASELFYINLVGDGALVIEELMNDEYDGILMDINLPNINGDHLTKVIRDFPHVSIKNIPIVGLTANVFDQNIKNYLKAGMNTVLTKPFDPEILVETLLRFLR